MFISKNFTNGILTKIFILVFLTAITTAARAELVHESISNAVIVESNKLSVNHAKDSINYSFTVNNQIIEFTLEDNTRLLKNSENLLDGSEASILKGRINGNKSSWARFSIINGVLTGAYYDGESLFFIKTYKDVEQSLSSNALNQPLSSQDDLNSITVVINSTDIEHNGLCALHTHAISNSFTYENYIKELSSIVNYNANATREINISVVADAEYTDSSDNPITDMVSELNIADGIFSEQLNIQLTLAQAIALDDNTDPSRNIDFTSTSPEPLLISFRNSDIANPGLRHLFTGKNLAGSVVGIAYVRSLCGVYSVGLTQRLGASTALVLTHELGHNFGANHDNQSGSVCASTPNGFVMSPNINTGGNQFSECSIESILPVIAEASSGFNACVSDVIVMQPPVITSTANTEAEIGVAYSYDADNTLEVTSESEITFFLDIAPDGMTIDNGGVISWTPSELQVGVNPVQVTVQNAVGSDTQFFEINVESDFINFENVTFSSFGDQDKSGSTTIGSTPFELVLTGNNWKSIPFDYNVTANTMLEFELLSNKGAEIHGIGFENDNLISPGSTFNFYGSQDWGIQAFEYTEVGTFVKFEVPVGQYFRGQFNQLLFLLDNDKNRNGSDVIFKNVKVYESSLQGPEIEFINLAELTFTAHAPGPDKEGTVTIVEDGYGVELVGNRWRKVVLDSVSITPNTVLEFEFKSTAIGEIHGLGFLPGESLDRDLSFKVYGKQRWGIDDFTYVGDGEYQKFFIPVGQYFTQDNVELVFIMDHDKWQPDGNSTFKNIAIYEVDE